MKLLSHETRINQMGEVRFRVLYEVWFGLMAHSR